MSKNVIVIGAGIAGACCAAWLREKGMAVTMVERAGPGEATSFGNAGSISPSAVIPIATPGMLRQIPRWLTDPLGPLTVRPSYLLRALPWLIAFLRCANREQMMRSAHALRSLLAPVFECYEPIVKRAHAEKLISREGIIFVHDSEAEFLASKPGEEVRRKLGAVLEDISAADIQRMAPGISSRFRWGTYAPENGFTVNPQRLTRALVDQVVADGGTLVQADVRDIRRRNGKVSVLLSRDKATDEMAADAVVIAAGAWSHRLAARIGDRVPLETQRGYHVTVANPGVGVNRMVSWVRRRVFATPMDVGMRFAGTVEIAGLDARPNWKRADVLLELGKQMYPDMNTASVSRWMGHRPCLPDSLPVIGPSHHVPNVFYAFGHGHIGMCSGGGTGRTIAELVAGEKPQIDITPFRADRF